MLHQRPPTEFENRVFEVARRIPAGRVATYLEVARQVGCASPRAVGQALRRNPFAPEVPCHRVIRSDGTLGGFHGETGGERLEQKRSLLLAEGIGFDQAGSVRPEHLHRFP